MTTEPTMIPWHPKPGDIPPVGCEFDWADGDDWMLWQSEGDGPNWNPVIYAEHLDASVGTFKFRIPAPTNHHGNADTVDTDHPPSR